MLGFSERSETQQVRESFVRVGESELGGKGLNQTVLGYSGLCRF